MIYQKVHVQHRGHSRKRSGHNSEELTAILELLSEINGGLGEDRCGTNGHQQQRHGSHGGDVEKRPRGEKPAPNTRVING